MRTPVLILSLIVPLSSQLLAGSNYTSGEFALKLYKELARVDDKNIAISPLSITIAMGMTYAGANGKTREEMSRVFGFPLDDDALHPALGTIHQNLNSLNSDSLQIAMVSKQWADKDYNFLESYLKTVESAYSAPLELMSFRKKPNESRDTINAWVERSTQGRIEELLPKDAIDSLTVLVLTNALYFKGQWADKFDTEDTHTSPFHAPSKQVECQMMSRTGMYAMHVGQDYSMIELPYVGNSISMVVLLPDESTTLNRIEANLTHKELSYALNNMASMEVNLRLPKFRMETKQKLSDPLRSLGMPLAFSNYADFTRMSAIPELKISEVFHNAFVEVTEEGTEAAAATATVIMRKSAMIPHNFKVNRPFLFLIRERSSGEILFIGRVLDPSL